MKLLLICARIAQCIKDITPPPTALALSSGVGCRGGSRSGERAALADGSAPPDTVPEPKPKKQKSELDQAILNIKKLVTKYQGVNAQASMLLTHIESGGSWEWAQSQGMTKNLHEALEELKDQPINSGRTQKTCCSIKNMVLNGVLNGVLN